MLGTYRAVGEIDASTARAFEADLRDAIDHAVADRVVVDCSGVTFMDSTGYHVLVDATEYAVRQGHVLVICNMSLSCERLLRLCDTDRELGFEARDASI